MNNTAIIASHYSSMNKVYEYIDNNLQGDLSLLALSQISGYSEYHFHRIFHALTGRTLREYVLERRIYSAANRLLYEDRSITQIAYDSGFSSSSSFIRSFKNCFGCSPSSYRKTKVRRRPKEVSHAEFVKYETNRELELLFSIVDLSDLRVAGIVTQGLSKDFQSRKIEKSFKRLFAWLKKRNYLREGMLVMGITLDTPEVVPFSDCRYFACVSADESYISEGEVSVRTFRTKGQFIKFSLERKQSDFSEQFFKVTDYLYGSYMPKLGCYPDNRPFIEMYSQQGSQIIISFHVPIR